MTESKPFWQSKVLWINTFTLLVAILSAQNVVHVVPPNWLPYSDAVVAALNILLRFATNQPLALSFKR